MAELTAKTGANDYIDELIYSFGTTHKDGVIRSSFGWKGKLDDIQYLESSCNACTKVWMEDNIIHYELTISKVQTFPKGQTTVTKDIYIYLNDGNERFIANEKKQKIQNPEKKYIRYRITGLVIV